MIEINGVCKFYGPYQVLKNCTGNVERGAQLANAKKQLRKKRQS